MKKIVFSALAVGVIFAAGLNLRLNTQNGEMSDIGLANVEALATEVDNPCPNAAKQWDPPAWFYDDHTFIKCGDCAEREGHDIVYGC
jgi:hypothetical protein